MHFPGDLQTYKGRRKC